MTGLFIAGGIGSTPILSMIRYCDRQGWNCYLLSLAPSGAHAAFFEELRAFGADRARSFRRRSGTPFRLRGSIFCSGTGYADLLLRSGLVMNAVGNFSSNHPDNPASFEWFSTSVEVGTGEVSTSF
jgi:tetrachlorobenzoquinone reductase